jgi:hypothetical protein
VVVPEEGEDIDDGDEREPASNGGDGRIQINDDSFDVTDVRRCEPFSDGEGNLDWVADDGALLPGPPLTVTADRVNQRRHGPDRCTGRCGVTVPQRRHLDPVGDHRL